jgi:hypothetical protein
MQAGPDNQVASAMHFYRALRVYPQPVELLMSECFGCKSDATSLYFASSLFGPIPQTRPI